MLAPAMKRVLVVEDDPDIVELIVHYLRSEGFEVEAEDDGRRALERLRAGQHHLVILDLQLPGLDGLSLCAELRRDKRTRALPVIMLTARGDEADRVVGLEVGADDYVSQALQPQGAGGPGPGPPAAARAPGGRRWRRWSSGGSRSTPPVTRCAGRASRST